MSKCRCSECGHEHDRVVKAWTEQSVRERIEIVERDLRKEIQKGNFHKAINGSKEVSVAYSNNFFPDYCSDEFKAIKNGLGEKFKEFFFFSIVVPEPDKGVDGFEVYLQTHDLYR